MQARRSEVEIPWPAYDPEFYEAPKAPPGYGERSTHAARLLLLRLRDRQRPGLLLIIGFGCARLTWACRFVYRLVERIDLDRADGTAQGPDLRGASANRCRDRFKAFRRPRGRNGHRTAGSDRGRPQCADRRSRRTSGERSMFAVEGDKLKGQSASPSTTSGSGTSFTGTIPQRRGRVRRLRCRTAC